MTDQLRSTTVNSGAPLLTRAGTPPDHRSTVAANDDQAATWHATSAATSACRSHVSLRGNATSANWIPLAHVAATSATDAAEG
ncbi:hypothetical protein Tco_0538906, partial [Tanacetum coccineum]